MSILLKFLIGEWSMIEYKLPMLPFLDVLGYLEASVEKAGENREEINIIRRR